MEMRWPEGQVPGRDVWPPYTRLQVSACFCQLRGEVPCVGVRATKAQAGWRGGRAAHQPFPTLQTASLPPSLLDPLVQGPGKGRAACGLQETKKGTARPGPRCSAHMCVHTSTKLPKRNDRLGVPLKVHHHQAPVTCQAGCWGLKSDT